MNILLRIVIILGILSGAAWLLFSLIGGSGDKRESSIREELTPINSEKLAGNYKEKTGLVSLEKKEEAKPVEKTETKAKIVEKEIPKVEKKVVEAPKVVYQETYSDQKMEEKRNVSEIVEGELNFSVDKWSLLGELKNVLVIEARAKNGLDQDIASKEVLFTCTASDGTVLSKSKTVSINSMTEASFTMVMGNINPNITSVECLFQNAEERVVVVNSLSGSTNSNERQNKSSERAKETAKEKVAAELGEDFPLPEF